MSGNLWTINSQTSLIAFTKNVEKLYSEHKHITYAAPRIGADRSMDQNALFHVWIAEYVAHLRQITVKDANKDKGLLAGMKRIIKQRYTAYNPDSKAWMVHTITNPFTGESKKDYTSSRSWKRGEMFLVLNWLQLTAAEDGLILESRGEFNKLQREHNGD